MDENSSERKVGQGIMANRIAFGIPDAIRADDPLVARSPMCHIWIEYRLPIYPRGTSYSIAAWQYASLQKRRLPIKLRNLSRSSDEDECALRAATPVQGARALTSPRTILALQARSPQARPEPAHRGFQFAATSSGLPRHPADHKADAPWSEVR